MAIGPDAELFVDANGAFDRKQALAFATGFADLGVSWFEEPVSSDDLSGLRLLRDRAPPGMEIAAGSIVHAGTLNVFKLEPRFIALHSEVALATRPVVIAGSGGNEADFREEAKTLGIAGGFRWAGFRHDLPNLFANAKLFSHPSSRFTYASSDRVLQESQLAGVPPGLVGAVDPEAHQLQVGVSDDAP